jgi:hypothetical protein
MKAQNLIKFFKHVIAREDSHGIPNAFRFKSISSSRKKGTLYPAYYKYDGEDLRAEEERETITTQVRRNRRKRPSQSDIPALIIDLDRLDGDNVQNERDTTSASSSSNQPARSPATTQDTIMNPARTGLYTPEKTPFSDNSETVTPKKSKRVIPKKGVGTSAKPSVITMPRRSGRVATGDVSNSRPSLAEKGNTTKSKNKDGIK